jgi:hypothetical protein
VSAPPASVLHICIDHPLEKFKKHIFVSSCIVFSGTAVPKETSKESAIWIVRKVVQEFFGLQLIINEVGACHRLSGNRIVAEFLNRLENSNFKKLLSAQCAKRNDQFLYISLHQSVHDKELVNFARILKRNGEIGR